MKKQLCVEACVRSGIRPFLRNPSCGEKLGQAWGRCEAVKPEGSPSVW